MQDAYQLEQSTDRLGLEDGTGAILLEQSAASFTPGIINSPIRGGGLVVLLLLVCLVSRKRRAQ